MGHIDADVNQRLAKYRSRYFAAIRKASVEDRRRLLGVHLLTDSKYDPIEVGSNSTLAGSKNENTRADKPLSI